MNFLLDIPKLIRELLPIALRQLRQFDWLRSLLKGVEYVLNKLNQLREKSLYEISITAQVIMIERVLNDRFDPSLRRIYITDSLDGIDYVNLYLEAEQQAAPALYLDTEIPPGAALPLYTDTEYAANMQFIVWVPAVATNIVAQEVRVAATVNNYKFGGTQYSIEYY